MECPDAVNLGFIGIGSMGEAMVARLIGSGKRLMIWNRSPERCAPLAAMGASVAESADALFSECDVIILMLANAPAIYAVLGRDPALLAGRVRDKTVVQMGTILPEESAALRDAIANGGGRYVEALVSGSRKPAEDGQLVCMFAGPHGAFEALQGVLAPMCRKIVDCGAVPNALAMKMSVNVVLVSQVAAFAEAVNLARASGVDLQTMAQVLLDGPMSNDLMRVKLPKLLANEMRAQASIRDVHYNCRLILTAAARAGASTPLVEISEALYRDAAQGGCADQDMAAVIRAIERRSGENG